MTFVLVFAAALVLPVPALLIVALPWAAVLAQRRIIDPAISFGATDIQWADVVLVVHVGRVLAESAVRRRAPRIPSAWLAFFATLSMVTLLALPRFGQEAFLDEARALGRFLAQGVATILIANTTRGAARLRASWRAWSAFGWLLAVSVLVEIPLQLVGLSLGEVQTGTVGTRYFGLLGDQVGFLLPVFALRELLRRRFVAAAVFGAALLATGTRGALLTLVVAIVLLVVQHHRAALRRRAVAVTALALVLAGVVATDLGGMRSRWTDADVLSGGWESRVVAFREAAGRIAEHPLVGSGLGGFTAVGLSDVAPPAVNSTANQWLQVMTDGGLVGLAGFAVLLVAWLRALTPTGGSRGGFVGSGLESGRLWILALALGAQSVAWLVPGSTVGWGVWVLWGLGLATRSHVDAVARRARRRASHAAAVVLEAA